MVSPGEVKKSDILGSVSKLFFCEKVQVIGKDAQKLPLSRWIYFLKLLTGGNSAGERNFLFLKKNLEMMYGGN